MRAAERHCAALARRHAKNFYWGFLALPRHQRVAIYALYDFARQVDDAADGESAATASARLLEQRERLRRCLAGRCDDPVMRVLAVAIDRYRVPEAELVQVIDGVQMDLRCKRYRSWPELESYCRLVASSIGRMCVRIFGFRDPSALELADQLGLAMQLTNILRDVREDFELGRVYLPLDELARFGLSDGELAARHLGPGWDRLVAFEANRARTLFERGLRVTALIPRSSAACVRTMAGIYQDLLRRIERDPQVVLDGRLSLSPPAKLRVALKAWLAA